ncbi:MAG: hypothetical protein KC731_27825, partial [Myxococcales bacterium]|nr:hypothetical protein [Myxococcales bacterium]
MSQRSFTSSSWSLIGVSAVALMLVAASGGCELIAKVDRDLIPGPTGGGTAEGGGGAGAMGGMGGEGGGMGGCDMPSDCPGEDTTCSTRTCVNQVCGTDLAPAGTPCTEDGGTQCDGAGMCVTPQCMNGVVDGTETDVDCGGAECPACDNGDICVEGADCTSGFCEPQGGAGGGGGVGGVGGQGGSAQGG